MSADLSSEKHPNFMETSKRFDFLVNKIPVCLVGINTCVSPVYPSIIEYAKQLPTGQMCSLLNNIGQNKVHTEIPLG